MKLYKIFAGKRTGPGSMDAQGFSSNGLFYHYLAKNKPHAIKQFGKEYPNHRIYDIWTRKR